MRVSPLYLRKRHARSVEHDRYIDSRIVYLVDADVDEDVMLLAVPAYDEIRQHIVQPDRIEFGNRLANAEGVAAESAIDVVLRHAAADPVCSDLA